MQITLRKVGGSTMLAIPPAILELLDWGLILSGFRWTEAG